MQLGADTRSVCLNVRVLLIRIGQVPDIPLRGVEGRGNVGAAELRQIEGIAFELDDCRVAVLGLQPLDAALLQTSAGPNTP